MSIIRKATLQDIPQIFDLYKAVARHNPGNLTQEEYEITMDYVTEMLENSLQRGMALVVEKDSKIIGYFKAFTSRFKCLAHILGDATLMVHPDYQGLGYGAKLAIKVLENLGKEMPHIMRLDIVPHYSCPAVKMYTKLGFRLEYKMEKKS